MSILAGSPLLDGTGWRLLVSRTLDTGQPPPAVEVFRNNQSQAIQVDWQPQSPPAELQLPLNVQTIRLNNPFAGSVYRIRIASEGFDRRWKTLPNTIPPEGVSFLFASCFWRNDDKQGAYAAGIDELQQRFHPAFKILSGDQVYLDWPASPFQSGADKINSRRYFDYWTDPNYRRILNASPSLFTCDDHEYWNDYPEFQIHLSRTHTAGRRREYGQSADALYEMIQHSLNDQVPATKAWDHPLGIDPPTKRWYSFSIGTVSFFVADTRSGRQSVKDSSAPQFFQDEQWDDLESWQQGLTGPGVLVLGQPLFQTDGDFRDHSLSNFANDYARLCALIEDSQRGRNGEGKPHHILMLSGDIHTGRLSVGTIKNSPQFSATDLLPDVYEFISSPASRIGPFTSEAKPEPPPAEIKVAYVSGGTTRPIRWSVRNVNSASGSLVSDGGPTVDNNVGMVKMTPGSMGRVRFELSLWRVRKSRRPTWKFWIDRDESSVPSFGRLFTKEILLD